MNALGIVFSELHDKNIPELTKVRTLASVPFGGRYRFIDFVLSNMVNSGIDKIGVITKSHYQSLMDHIGSGKSWDLNRKNGGLIVLPPHGAGGTELYRTRFEAIKSIYMFIRDSSEEFVVISDCDNVCNIDLEDVLKSHMKNNADITVVYRDKFITDKSKLVFDLDNDGRVRKAYYSIREGKQNAYTNILIMKRAFLLNLIEHSDLLGIHGIARGILIQNSDIYKIHAYKFSGFYASVDSLENYFKHSLEILQKPNRDSLFNSERPIFTKVRDSAPARFSATADVSNSLIADGCVIDGQVKNSVLFRGVTVASGAKVENSIIMQGTIISRDCKLNCVICDKNAVIRDNTTLSGHPKLPYYVGKNTIL